MRCSVLALLILIALRLPAYAQTGAPAKVEESLYYRALVAVLAVRSQDLSYRAATDPLRQVLIEKDDLFNQGFPSQIGEVAVEYLTIDDLRVRHQALKQSIPVFVMRPIANEGDKLIIGFVRLGVTQFNSKQAFLA